MTLPWYILKAKNVLEMLRYYDLDDLPIDNISSQVFAFTTTMPPSVCVKE